MDCLTNKITWLHRLYKAGNVNKNQLIPLNKELSYFPITNHPV